MAKKLADLSKLEGKEFTDKPNTYSQWRSIGSAEYKYVQVLVSFCGRKATFRAQISRMKWSKCYDNLHGAAKAVDLFLISKGMNPVNVLKKNYE